jgi:hypothetical protein
MIIILIIKHCDIRQYFGNKNQNGGSLTGNEMRQLFEEICKIIKSYLVNSLIALDFSTFILNNNDATNQIIIWWNIFKESKFIDLIHVSYLNENESLLLNSINILTGKKIILTNGILDINIFLLLLLK